MKVDFNGWQVDLEKVLRIIWQPTSAMWVEWMGVSIPTGKYCTWNQFLQFLYSVDETAALRFSGGSDEKKFVWYPFEKVDTPEDLLVKIQRLGK